MTIVIRGVKDDSNFIKLVAAEQTGYLFFNGKFITELDLSKLTNAGDVFISIGIEGDNIEGSVSLYSGFTIWSLPAESAIEKEQAGADLVRQFGCTACYSTDGMVVVGPSLKGLYGQQKMMADGTTITVDEAYLRESILEPNVKVVEGYSPVMPDQSDTMTDDQIAEIIEYIKSLK